MSKPFSIADIRLYPREVCLEAKKVLNKYNRTCMTIVNAKKVGSMNWLIDACKPKSPEDFYNAWVHDDTYKKSDDPEERGRTIDELYHLSLEYQAKCDMEIPVLTYFQDILMHTIYQTWDGRIKEEEVKRKFEERGYTVEHSHFKEDSRLNIDFLVYKEGKLQFLVQVKPISTFMNNAPWAPKTRKYFFKKQAMGRKKYGVPYYYLIYNTHYDTDTKWVYNDKRGSFFFTLEELCSEDGMLKKGVDLSTYSERAEISS